MNEKPTSKIVVEDLDSSFRDEVASVPGGENITKCFACGTCAAGCPVTNVDEEYNCRKIIRQVLLGLRDDVLKSPVIWLCALCYRCTARCPQGVNFTDVMRALRFLAIREGAAPPDMLASNDQIERLAQLIRRDLIKGTTAGRKEVIEELKAKIAKA
ncbi:MAG: 4Fe-4S dicluster domain-containing protein [Phycisphaerae bacterium]|jgi:heterodisulfide reductase subunit C